MRRHRTAPGLALVLAACGLSSAPTGPGTPSDAGVIELGAGTERAVPGTVVRIGFERITEDSRCPIGVVCVWEGNAAAEIAFTAGSGPTELRSLNTALEPRSVDFAGLRVTLTAVAPQPRDGEPIPPEEYVARLRVESLTP